MRDDQDKRQQAKEIQQELKSGLSRRAFLDRLKAIGVGFGAAFVFGVNRSEAAVPGDALVSLKSTNPALNDIIEESQQDQPLENENTSALDETDPEGHVQLAQDRRIPYRRGVYRRVVYPRVPYARIVPPYRRIPYARIIPPPYRRIPYLRGPYRRIPYARLRF
jgi:hypothetical protein